MNRPLFAWSIFGICLLLTTLAVTWLTRSAWEADQARQQALIDSELQNALWRMDSLVAPLLTIEINRPSLSGSFANTPMLDPKLIKGYVIKDAAGKWTIRHQGRITEREPLPADCPLIAEDWSKRLTATTSLLMAANERPGSSLIGAVGGQGGQMGQSGFGGNLGQFGGQGNGGQAGQSGQRNQLVQRLQNLSQQSSAPNPGPEKKTAFPPLQPVWVNGELVFARQVPVADQPGKAVVEICWLNWKEWEGLLAEQLDGMNVGVEMRPYTPKPETAVSQRTAVAMPLSLNPSSADAQPHVWQMVSLPIRLVPKSQQVPTAVPRPLLAVWILLIAVAAAFAWLLHQTLNLSERRAAFVSAVTHELRTPLTTFRLYTEMLSDGIATDPQQQQTYFQTLNREANRLTHLVENVLAYARLEHGRSTARNETLTVGDLITRCQSRLEQRVAESPLSLSVHVTPDAQAARLTTNAMAVEQILFNVIDNACKYARESTDPRLRCEVWMANNKAHIQISDFGPGLSTAARRTLFQPFQKSSSQAAESAPGIGLGLALSHRLARELQGSLVAKPNTPSGLCMELQLPACES